MVFESIFNMVKKLKDVKSIEAAVQKSVHAFKSRLPDVQPIVHCVLERPHFHLTHTEENPSEVWKNSDIDDVTNEKKSRYTHLSDQFFAHFGLVV